MDLVRCCHADAGVPVVSHPLFPAESSANWPNVLRSSSTRLILFRDVRKLQIEDWFMLLIFCFYTVLIVFLNICADVSTNLIEPEDIPKLSPQDISDRVWGSKCVLVVESMMCAVQWGTKACLLILYYRLTENLRQSIVVQIAAGYCLITYIVMISLYYGYWCRPFTAFWETPTPDIQCATQTHHLIVNLSFNLTSDLMIICIPLPMFIKAHLEFRKKLLLIFPFSLGFFTMVCAILSKHLSFTQPFSSEWLFWYTREASTAVIVSNMPYSWAIFRKVFHVKSFLRSGETETNDPRTISERHWSTATAPATTDRLGSNARPWSVRRLSSLNPFGKSNAPQQRNPSTSETAVSLPGSHDGLNTSMWKRTQDTDGKGDPLGTSSIESRSVKSVGAQPPMSDIDRLYRLDDDELEMTGFSNTTQRQYEP